MMASAIQSASPFCWARVRGAVEGLFFLLQLPLFLLGARVSGRLDGRLWARWGWLARRGLRGVREAWWGTLQYETEGAIWRHVLLTEWVETGRSPASSTDAGEIMVHVPGHIGDLLHAVPMLAELKKQRPVARVSLVVGPWCEGLARQLAPVDEIIVHAPQLIQWGRGIAANSWSVTRELKILRQCREKRVDVLITTSPVDPALLLFSRGVAPKRWVACGECPAEYRHASDDITAYDHHEYEAQRIMNLLKALGLEPVEAKLRWDESSQDGEIPELSGSGEGPIVAFAPGAGWPGKLWPGDRFAQLGDWLVKQYRARLVLLGSADERALADDIAAAMPPGAMNLAGRTSLDAAARVLRRCALLVTNDNGLLHVAAALGTPTLALFGPTSPEQWAPRGRQHAVVRGSLSCPECHPWHPRARCVAGESCMASIALDAVKQTVEQMELPALGRN